MKPTLRLLQVLVGAHRRGRLDPLAEAVTRWRVLPTDIDLFGHMNNSRYLAVMDLARIDFLTRIGLLSDVVRKRWIVPLGGVSLDFRGALRLFEEYEIGTRLAWWDDRWFYVEQEFRRVAEPHKPVGTGYVKTLFRGPEGPLPPARIVRRLLGRDLPRPPVPAAVAERFGQARSSTDGHGAAPRRARDVAGPPTAASAPGREPIALVGIGCRLPGGIESAQDLWQTLLAGRECIVDIPESRWDAKKFHDPRGKAPGRSYVQRAGLLAHDLRAFDAAFFGITPREASVLDPQQRLLLEVSWEALENAGIAADTLAGSRTGVFVGGFMMDNLLLQSSPDNRERLDSHSATASTLTLMSNRLSYFYDLRGPSVSMDTACSSSLVALHYACQSLWSGESEAALVGGANAILWPETQITMAKGRFLSPRGRCHAFSDQADGYVRSEGAAVLVLKPLSAAQRDGNPIHALILGTAVNQDGRTNGITVPSGEAQVAVMRDAYACAGVDPRQVVYVEAHGTGTPVGDPIEAGAIGRVVGTGRDRGEPCRMGSVKTNLGHLEAAAGVTGVIKAALTLAHGVVPPHPHLERVNPNIPLAELGLHIPTRPEPLPLTGHARLAGVNSFGYGGTNAHVVLAEPPAPDQPGVRDQRPAGRPHLLVLGARASEALATLAGRYADWLAAGTATPEELCRSAAVHRAALRHRVALRAADRDELLAALRAVASGATEGPGVHQIHESPDARKLLFVYTGMGPQWWAMGRQLMAAEPVYRAAVEECDALFRDMAGWSIAEELMRDEASSRITRTEVAQPANAVVQIALTRLWASWGVVPDAVLGHSIGEVGAAFASGALDMRDALTVAFHRSRLQQRLAGMGGMLAVGIGAGEAAALVRTYGPGVDVAAVNSERSVTLAGERSALERIAAELAAAGTFQRFLQVEVPYHSPVMDEIGDALRTALGALAPAAPRISIYSTVTGQRLDSGRAHHDAGYWWRNARGTVRFAEALQSALGDDHGLFVEIGPHPVLAPSIREGLHAARVRGETMASLVRNQPEQVTMVDALGRLHAAGAAIDWRDYYGPGRYTGAPSYAWQRPIHWEESHASLARRRAFAGHPMLIAGDGLTWTAEASLAALPYLADHQVAGSLLFPGAGHVELALAARHALTGQSSCSVEELELSSAVVLTADMVTRLTLALSEDTPVFRIRARTGEQTPVLCAQGKLFSAGHPPRATMDVRRLAARLPENVPVDALYEALARRGLCYGPAFRGVVGLRRGPGEVLARLALPAGVDHEGYHLHPVLLDAAFHSLIAAAHSDEDHDIVPVHIERVHVLGSPGPSALAYGRVVVAGGNTLSGDITLLGEDGAVLVEITGFTCRFLPRASASADSRLRSWTYARVWMPLPASTDAGDTDSARWVALGPAREALPPGWLHAADDDALARILASVPEGAPVHVADLRWAEPAARPDDSVDPVARGTADAAALLRTVQALPQGRIARYHLVTACAEAVSADDDPALERAPLVGLARTVMTERPDLRLTLVDIEPPCPDLTALHRRLACLGHEQELAERAGQLYAARLERSTLTPMPQAGDPWQPVMPGAACELVLGEAGRLDTLAFAASERRRPGPGEVEIEVEVASLGFKDIMKAMGLLSERVKRNTYIGDAIGMEGAGRITAVGAGVTGLAVGDRVYGVAPGFLASHVVLPASHVVALADRLTFEQGSNLIVFLTAYYGLVTVARLQRGESVLIHGASGGMGLAAIEVARWCGAEIIATAGSEEKRSYLRQRGIAHVTHSRDLGFVDDVRAWTKGRGVDVVLNFTPGEIMTKGVALLAPFGRFIEIGKMSFEQDAALSLRPFNENLTYAALDFDRLLEHKPEQARQMYLEVMERFARGDFQPLPSQTWPASQVDEAFRTMARGKHIGKVCVALRDPELRLRSRARQGRLEPDATYLVTGGLGGFGLAVAEWLAAEGARHLVLVSRRGPSSGEAQEALARLRGRGIDVRTHAVDVADAGALASVLAGIQATMPPLRGVVHSAAVLDDRPLAELDRTALDRVMAAKARGAWNLHELTQSAHLDFLVLFSSISSLIGNASQGNYVAANAFLDQLALHRRRRGLPAAAVQWGVLGETGLVARDAGVARHLEHLGIRGLATRHALHAFGRVLDCQPEQMAVVDVDWGRLGDMLDPWAGTRRLASLLENSRADVDDQVTSRIRATFGSLDQEASQALLEATLARVVARVLRMSAEGLPPGQPLRELGMDSIMALEIVTGIEGELGIKLSTMDVASGPSIRELAGIMLGQVQAVAQVQIRAA